MLRKLLSLLTADEKRRGALVMAMVTVMAGLEAVGVASVMPFLSVLGNPGVVHTNDILSRLYTGLGFSSVDQFLTGLGVAVFVFILLSSGFRMITLYAMNRFVEMRRHSISKRLLETYLRQPYAFFLSRNSSDMAKSILSEVDQLIMQVLLPAMEMLAYAAVLVGILTLLVVIDPLIALIVTGVFAGIYGVVYLLVRGILERTGRDRVDANKGRFAAAGEALGGIKDIKLLGREHAYLNRFQGPSMRFARHQATNNTLSQLPKFLVEAVAFGSVLVLSLVLVRFEGGVGPDALGDVLPVLGLYALAGLRIKPAAQKIYMGMAKLRFGAPAVDAIIEDMQQRGALAELHREAPEAIRPEQEVALEDVHYTYPSADSETLCGIDLHIPVGSSLGLVGTTGAGKTTLVDVLLGLLRPTQGAITVDGEPVTESNLRAYQRALGYVPQDIFLADLSVAENIALGVAREELDQAQVERCARMAQVHDFVLGELPEGYETQVGERGVRLSGGQRQRIGIARALYHDPDILVFDEATSALDNVTEKAVMEAIDELQEQKTVIIIAHRLTTVRNCSRVVVLEKGAVRASGTFDELQQQNEVFEAR